MRGHGVRPISHRPDGSANWIASDAAACDRSDRSDRADDSSRPA